MAIIIRLDRMMADRKMSLNELAEKVGMTNVNLSNLKTGKMKGIRFETLDAICQAVPIPVNAIGGLNASNMDVLKGIDIAGVCAVSAIMKAESPRNAAESMKKKFREIKG